MKRYFDTHDTILEGEIHSQQADQFTRPPSTAQNQSEAVPTGLDDGIATGIQGVASEESDLDLLRRMRRG